MFSNLLNGWESKNASKDTHRRLDFYLQPGGMREGIPDQLLPAYPHQSAHEGEALRLLSLRLRQGIQHSLPTEGSPETPLWQHFQLHGGWVPQVLHHPL